MRSAPPSSGPTWSSRRVGWARRPDDLTREAIAAVCGETPVVDAALETWLRGLWARRGIPFPAINLKQAWLIPSARPSPTRTAPRRAGGSTGPTAGSSSPCPARRARCARCGTTRSCPTSIGAASGRPRRAHPAPRRASASRSSPTGWARRSSAGRTPRSRPTPGPTPSTSGCRRSGGRRRGRGDPARTATELLDEVEPVVLAAVGEHVWARGATTWAEALDGELERLGRSLAAREIGTGGALGTLLGARSWLTPARVAAGAAARGRPGRSGPGGGRGPGGRRVRSRSRRDRSGAGLGHRRVRGGRRPAAHGPSANAGLPRRGPGTLPRGDRGGRRPARDVARRDRRARPRRRGRNRPLAAGRSASAGRSARGRAGRR